MFKIHLFGLAAVLTATIIGPASADVVSFQEGVNGYAGTQDTYISSGSIAGRNYGVTEDILVGAGSGIERRALFQFDVSSLAGQYTSITSAQFKLTQIEGSAQFSDFDLYAYQIADANAGWVEGTGNGTSSSAPNWVLLEGPDTYWAGSSGLHTADTDYVDTVLDSVTYSSGGAGADMNGTVYTFDLPGSLIEQWVTGVNAGLLIFASSEVEEGLARFASSEFTGNASWRPQLVVEFAPIPEPASLALAGFGGLFLLQRNRQRRAR